MIIAPLKAYLVSHKLNNPSDTNQHWVRVVIKNAISGVVLDTLDLTDNGSNYFSKLWQTPVDSTGTGLQLQLIKTVYDDAYSTESLVYGTTVEDIMVKDIAGVRTLFGGTGGGRGADVDYKKIEKMIRDAIAEIPQVEIPEQKEVELGGLEESIKSHIDESDKSEELAELKATVQGVSKAIEKLLRDKEVVSEQKLNEVCELPEKFQMAETSDAELHDHVSSKTDEHTQSVEELKQFIISRIEELEQKVEEYTSKPVQIELTGNSAGERKQKEVKEVSPHEQKIRNLLGAY